MKEKIILHLCADIGSDSYPYQLDSDYKVILVGKDIGVENYNPPKKVHGIIANPVCKSFSNLHGLNRYKITPNLSMLNHCQRIIKEANPVWWVIENPAMGKMKEYLGPPKYIYHPWEYGSPWTKKNSFMGKI